MINNFQFSEAREWIYCFADLIKEVFEYKEEIVIEAVEEIVEEAAEESISYSGSGISWKYFLKLAS